MSSEDKAPVEVEVVNDVVIRLAGDSGDGMQLTGTQLTNTSAVVGNDLATFPDYPAEIRAPAGTLPGVSSFQVHLSSFDIHSPGDSPDVLVAMNPAALKVNLVDLERNALVIVNTGNFGPQDLKKAGYDYNPLESHDLDAYRVIEVDLNKLTRDALKDSGLDSKAQLRCKNFFALGMMFWVYSRPLDLSIKWIHEKFGKKPQLAHANENALKAGYHYCDVTGVFQTRYEVPPAKLPSGTYRNIMGNQALGLGLVAASKLADLPLFLGSYPITPASDILHQLSEYKHYGVITYQAEDEIAACCAAIGAAYAGNLAVTTTSGPGVALKTEAMGLAVMTELPLVVVNIQRAGPSTGMPTKTEQADLLQAFYGRNGECPMVILAAATPADCFHMAIEACRLAVKHMVPVMLLSDGYVANGAEPWNLPHIDDLPTFHIHHRDDPEGYLPYMRDPETLARPWVRPGTPKMAHRIGGLEKADGDGNVSYDPANHEMMCRTRADKVMRIQNDIPEAEVMGAQEGKLLVLSWGGTAGSLNGPVERELEKGEKSLGWLHLRHLHPFPKNLGEILRRYEKVVVAELNLGQLLKIVRSEFAIDAEGFQKIQGRPFTNSEVVGMFRKYLG